MDKVFIKGLHIQTTIGFFQWEKEIKQTLVIDVAMAWDTASAAENDELAKTLDYAEISVAIEKFANDNPVDLFNDSISYSLVTASHWQTRCCA